MNLQLICDCKHCWKLYELPCFFFDYKMQIINNVNKEIAIYYISRYFITKKVYTQKEKNNSAQVFQCKLNFPVKLNSRLVTSSFIACYRKYTLCTHTHTQNILFFCCMCISLMVKCIRAFLGIDGKLQYDYTILYARLGF